VHGLTLRTSTPAHLARAAVEGMLCALADGLDALVAQGTVVNRIILVGGGARSAAVRRIAPEVFGLPVIVPAPGEYVADGAARQAAWVLAGGGQPQPPGWSLGATETYEATAAPVIREQYAAARDLTVDRPA
jgi:xylulokinase